MVHLNIEIHRLNIEIHVKTEVKINCPYNTHAKYQNPPQNIEIQIEIKAKSILTFSIDFVYGQQILTLIRRWILVVSVVDFYGFHTGNKFKTSISICISIISQWISCI